MFDVDCYNIIVASINMVKYCKIWQLYCESKHKRKPQVRSTNDLPWISLNRDKLLHAHPQVVYRSCVKFYQYLLRRSCVSKTYGQTDVWTDRRMDRQTYEQTDGWTDRRMDRQTDGQGDSNKTYLPFQMIVCWAKNTVILHKPRVTGFWLNRWMPP